MKENSFQDIKDTLRQAKDIPQDTVWSRIDYGLQLEEKDEVIKRLSIQKWVLASAASILLGVVIIQNSFDSSESQQITLASSEAQLDDIYSIKNVRRIHSVYN